MSKKAIFLFLIITLIALAFFSSAHAQDKCTIEAEIVFIVDTSGSMDNEWKTLCSVIDDVVDSLEKKDVILEYTIYGLDRFCEAATTIEDCKDEGQGCATAVLPYDGCTATQGDREQWGPAVADRAQNHPWAAPIKIIMPISDEGPYCGGWGCGNCKGNDGSSITAAKNAANANGVYVFPLEGDKSGSCCTNCMNKLVNETTANDQKFTWGGTAESMADAIYTATMMAAWDGDEDGYMTIECPCDPDDPPPGIIGCWDCDDADGSIIHECLYGGLVPCGRLVDDPDTDIDESAPCTLCHIFVLIKRIVDEIVMPYGSLLAVLIIVIGGIMFITAGGSPERIGTAKNLMKAAGIGLVIILASWLIVDTVIGFLTSSSTFQNWYEINCPVP